MIDTGSVNVTFDSYKEELGEVDQKTKDLYSTISNARDAMSAEPVEIEVTADTIAAQQKIVDVANEIKTKFAEMSDDALVEIGVDRSEVDDVLERILNTKVDAGELVSESDVAALANIISKGFKDGAADGAAGVNEKLEEVKQTAEELGTVGDIAFGVTVTTIGDDKIQTLKDALDSLQDIELNVNANVNGTDLVSNLSDAMNELTDKTVYAIAKAYGEDAVRSLSNAIDRLRSKTVSVTGDVSSASWASGTSGVKRNESALVNELGNETLVRDGQYHVIQGGAQFVNLKKGDIIFNHKQTEELMKMVLSLQMVDVELLIIVVLEVRIQEEAPLDPFALTTALLRVAKRI